MRVRKIRSQILIAGFLMLLVLPLSSFAQDLGNLLKRCAAIQDRDERLECYDKLSEPRPQAEMEQEVASEPLAGGEWKLTRETSPIDDSEVIYLSLVATEATPAGPASPTPTLFIRCKERNLESFINWGVPVGVQGADVTTRLDDEGAQTKRWLASSDLLSTFVPGSHAAFVAQLRAHHRLVARLVPLGHNETTVIFDLAGLNDVIGDVLAACKR